MEKQKAGVVKTPINVCVVSLGIVGADKMDKMNTYPKVVFIVNFSYFKRSVVYCPSDLQWPQDLAPTT